MAKKKSITEQGFQLHDCTVYPDRNAIVHGEDEAHVEPKAMQVLVVLASQPGAVVTREELLEQVWPETYSGDAALTRCISLLRSSLGDDSHHPRFIETVSKSGYRLLAPVTSIKPAITSKLVMLIALFVAIVIVAASALAFVNLKKVSDDPRPVSTPVENPSIAVLPFANMSGDETNNFLSDGFADELLIRLAKVPALTVISRSSSFTYRDSGQSPSEIASNLSVNHLLEGSVRKSGDRVRVSVQLIKANSEELLWSDSYDRELDDLLTIQDEIARAIVEALKITFNLADDSTPVVSNAAHEALLRGRFLVAQRTRKSLEAAVAEFQQALRIEPDYALAHAELTLAYMLLRSNQYGTLTESEAIGLGQPHAERAMELAPQLAEAHAAAGIIAWRLGKPSEAAEHFRQAIEISPNYAMVYHWLAMLSYRNLGQHQEAMAASEKARQLDPVSAPILTVYLQMRMIRGEIAEAKQELQKLRLLSEPTYLRIRGEVSSLNGHWANAALSNLDALMEEPDSIRAQSRIKFELVALGLQRELQAFEPVTSPLLLSYMGRNEEAVQRSTTKYQSDPLSFVNLRTLAQALAMQENFKRAEPYLEELWLKAEKRIAIISTGIFPFKTAIMLYAVRLDAGDESGAREIMEAMLVGARQVREAGVFVTRTWSSVDFAEGVALYLLGSREAGLVLMERAVQDGYFVRIHPPLLPGLFNDPAFVSILQIQQDRREREQRKLFSIVCADNPYEAVWQPSRESCETFHQSRNSINDPPNVQPQF